MDDAALVDVLERVGDLGEHVERALRAHRQRAARDQAIALDELHDHVRAVPSVLAVIDDADDVRVRDLARELRLLVKARARDVIRRKRRRDDLERERLAELDVLGAIDLPHPAFAQPPIQRITATHRVHYPEV